MKPTREVIVNMEGSSGQQQLVILAILRHWIKHPYAKDVCDGICKWWLPENLKNVGREKVQKAIDILVSRGWVTERLSKSTATIYGLNAEKLEEIENFLREAG